MKSELDKLVIDIEFLLISVIQAVAFGTVASGAVLIFTKGMYEYAPYAILGLLFVMMFWSQAIMHVLGFIRWPLDMFHNFLYFVVSMVEVMMFSVITDPFQWYTLGTVFVLLSGFLYYYDLRMIIRYKPLIAKTKEGKKLYDDLYKEQKRDLVQFVPAGVVVNFASAYVIRNYSQLFLVNHMHVALAVVQIIFAFVILSSTIQSFKRRVKLIEKL